MGVLAPGTMLGGCRIEAVVGKGGMGVVYRARQLELDRDVAVKVISPDLVEDPKTRSRFLNEARAAGAVEHPNVVPIHNAGIAEGRAYLVMRYVAGDDMREIVQRDGPLTPAAAATVTVQLGDALDAIHAAGYVHRDVKPRNVMLDEAGHVYLSDFGLAKQALSTAGPTTAEQWVGTLDYVAPEQIRAEPVDARADVYALGGVLYFLLTGHVPFEREGDHAKLWAHLHDDPPPPSALRREVPAELDAVVQRALAKDPAARHASAGDLGRAAWAAAHGAAAPATTVAARAGPPRPRRGPGRPVAAALTGVAAIAGLALLLAPDGRAPVGKRPRATPAPTPRPPPPQDRRSIRVGEVIRHVGFRPRGLVVVNRHVWVISSNQARITSIDVESARRNGPQPYIGRGSAAITRDGGTVWVASRGRRAVLGIAARSGKVTRHLDTPLPPTRVAAGKSGLWVVGRAAPGGPATLLHYDRDGQQSLGQAEFPDGIAAITLGAGYLWVAPERARRVMRVPPSGEPEHGGWLTAPASDLAFGEGYLWAGVTDGSVARIDPRRKLSRTRAAARRPAQLAVAGHHVFLAGNTEDVIVVIDPKTGRPVPRRLPVPGNPYGVAAGAGHVWVTGMAGNTLTRLDY